MMFLVDSDILSERGRHLSLHVYTQIYIYIHIHTHTYMRVYMCVCVYVSMYVCMYVRYARTDVEDRFEIKLPLEP